MTPADLERLNTLRAELAVAVERLRSAELAVGRAPATADRLPVPPEDEAGHDK